MYYSDQQIRLIRFFSLFKAKTRNGRLETAKNLDNSPWSLRRSRTITCFGVGVYSVEAGEESESKISDSVHLC